MTIKRLDDSAAFPALTGAGSVAGDLFLVFDISSGGYKSLTRTELANAVNAEGVLLPKTGGTITPAANANALAVTGYSLTGSDSHALLDLAGTWNTTGTPTGIKLDITDTASNAASLLMDLRVGGSSKFKVDKTGNVNVASTASLNALGSFNGNRVTLNNAVFGGGSKSTINAPVDGVLAFYNNALTDFSRVVFGGTTSSFPALKRSGTALLPRLADDSAGAPLNLTPQTAPATPASGWHLYIDGGDGNKLKAIASTGTVVTLGTP
jgi:hypothetical protein